MHDPFLVVQTCDVCDAPSLSASGSVNTLIERDHVIAAMAAGLTLDADDCERLSLREGADRRRISEWVELPGLPPGIGAVNVDLLRATLNDDDPAGFLAELGLSSDALGAILGTPVLADDSSAVPPPPGTIVDQKKRRGGGVGGFAPVVAVVYDERMLLHEEGSAEPPRRFATAVPGVQLPPHPASLHPERPDRLRSIAQHLAATGLFQRCRCDGKWGRVGDECRILQPSTAAHSIPGPTLLLPLCPRRVPARAVLDSELAGVHAPDYIAEIATLPASVDVRRGDALPVPLCLPPG